MVELCKELGVTRQTLCRHIGYDGRLRQGGQKMLDRPPITLEQYAAGYRSAWVKA